MLIPMPFYFLFECHRALEGIFVLDCPHFNIFSLVPIYHKLVTQMFFFVVKIPVWDWPTFAAPVYTQGRGRQPAATSNCSQLQWVGDPWYLHYCYDCHCFLPCHLHSPRTKPQHLWVCVPYTTWLSFFLTVFHTPFPLPSLQIDCQLSDIVLVLSSWSPSEIATMPFMHCLDEMHSI